MTANGLGEGRSRGSLGVTISPRDQCPCLSSLAHFHPATGSGLSPRLGRFGGFLKTSESALARRLWFWLGSPRCGRFRRLRPKDRGRYEAACSRRDRGELRVKEDACANL